MFNRKAYKDIAKKQLKGRMTTPVLATLFSFAIIAIFGLPNTIPTFKNLASSFTNPGNFFTFNHFENGNSFSQNFSYSAPQSGTNVSFLFTVISMCIEGVLTMAACYLFIILSHTTSKQTFGTYIKGFSFWLKGFLGMLWYSLWVFLWTLLFIVPGIVKSFAYSQMFFILAEYPNIGVRKAMQISKTMTKGNKGDLFVMCLSFIGWEILAGLTLEIGALWLKPYEAMSFTNAYHAMKAHAIQAGDLTEEDFINK